jgi:hypothetical protein
VWDLDGGKILAIERDEAVPSAQPKIAVAGLNDGIDAVVRQSVFVVPGLDIVLEHRLGWLQGKELRPEEEKSQSEQKTTPQRQVFGQRGHDQGLIGSTA